MEPDGPAASFKDGDSNGSWTKPNGTAVRPAADGPAVPAEPDPDGAGPSSSSVKNESSGDRDDEGEEDGNDEEDEGSEDGTSSEEEDVGDYDDLEDAVVERVLSPEQVEADLARLRGMWEMASVHDFLMLFGPQLKLSREFGCDELEHVLVSSAGDGGLLADLHADLLRGISPKSVIDPRNWAVHLANKIKFHWRGAPGGEPIPFRPDKRREAAGYAALPVAQRVRALHFVCCVRADRADIQDRIEEAMRPRTKRELESIEAARAAAAAARPTRGSKAAAAAFKPPEDIEAFRRKPIGAESNGITYYYLSGGMGSRLYRDVPADLVRARGDGAVLEAAAAATAAAAAEAAEQQQQRDRDRERKRKGRKRRQERRLVVAPLDIGQPEAMGLWELAAADTETLEAVGRKIQRTMKPQEKELGRIILEELAPDLREKQAVEQKRLKAAQRVARRLGEPSAFGDEFGRPRRERKAVNYAFTDYDDMLRGAIRQTQRGVEQGEELGDGQGRSRRGNSPTRPDPAAEYQSGLRRGRSVAQYVHREEAMLDISERALRLQAQERRAAEEEAATRRAEEDAKRAEEEAIRAAEAAERCTRQDAARAERGGVPCWLSKAPRSARKAVSRAVLSLAWLQPLPAPRPAAVQAQPARGFRPVGGGGGLGIAQRPGHVAAHGGALGTAVVGQADGMRPAWARPSMQLPPLFAMSPAAGLYVATAAAAAQPQRGQAHYGQLAAEDRYGTWQQAQVDHGAWPNSGNGQAAPQPGSLLSLHDAAGIGNTAAARALQSLVTARQAAGGAAPSQAHNPLFAAAAAALAHQQQQRQQHQQQALVGPATVPDGHPAELQNQHGIGGWGAAGGKPDAQQPWYGGAPANVVPRSAPRPGMGPGGPQQS